MLRPKMRPQLLRLLNPIQEYSWGSLNAIYDAFAWPATGRPAAELWLGAHRSAPSMVVQSATDTPETAELPSSYLQGALPATSTDAGVGMAALGDLIRENPDHMVGPVVTEEYGPQLPYLLKILAAAQPLSLQVHPRPHIARAGFQRENAAGLSLTSGQRNYKDPSHKPEMLIALTAFEGLCGFRRPQRTLELLAPLQGTTVKKMAAALRAQPNAAGVKEALGLTLELRNSQCADELAVTAASLAQLIAEQQSRGERISRGHLTASDLFRQYPEDPGSLVSLMLNRVSLDPGEAIYLGAGQIHAYLDGLGIEVMASSDNVLRAGLTPKRVDVRELMLATDFAPAAPMRPILRAVPGGLTQYRSPAAEFSLLHGQVTGQAFVTQSGPRIVLCLTGALTVGTALEDRVELSPGQSVFAPHGVGDLDVAGQGTLVVAYVP